MSATSESLWPDNLLPPVTLVHADAVEWLRGIATASADLVVTDPAYESLEKHRAIGTTTRLTNAWFPIFPNARFPELFSELYRVLKRNTHCYVFCDPETAFVIKPIGEAAGFKFWKPLVWDKQAIGMGYHYRARYELILFFEKGKRRLADLGIADVLPFKRVRTEFPTEKPAELMETLIRQSSEVSELVLDPFLGAGAVAVAAQRNARAFAGCDIEEKALRTSRERLLRA